MSATTDQVRDLLGTRLAELDEEKGRVQRALEALTATNGRAPRAAAREAGPRRPRRRRGKTRANQAVALIEGSPGISASGIAAAMRIKPNYLYRLLGDLEKEGQVKKAGREYFPAT